MASCGKSGADARDLGQEDNLLIELVQKHGTRTWSAIVAQMPGRTGKQCRERYRNQLDPHIRRGPWTEDENRAILLAQAKLGNRCSCIHLQLKCPPVHLPSLHSLGAHSRRLVNALSRRACFSGAQVDQDSRVSSGTNTQFYQKPLEFKPLPRG